MVRASERRCLNALIWRCERMTMKDFRRDRGKSEKYYGKVIRHDMIHIQLIEDMVLDRKLQKT